MFNKRSKKKNINKIGKNKIIVSILALLVIFINLFVIVSPALAQIDGMAINFGYKTTVERAERFMEAVYPFSLKTKPVNRLPESKELEVSYVKTVVFTAYNSEVGQCDSTPCITANGFNLCKHDKEDTIAMNGIKMGTKIKIPEYFGDRVFVVRDRMNSRYDSNRGDVWMKDKGDARQFGVRVARVEILK